MSSDMGPAGRTTFTQRRLETLILVAATFLPYAVGTLQVLQHGIPDTLLGGDAAALELATLRAARGAQLVGPYSRFGWNHPGPLFFYLALPIYEASGLRGQSLNLFAFLANFIASVLAITTIRRLAGFTAALLATALFAVFGTLALPYLLANSWNPIFPILPFVTLSLLTVELALGRRARLPLFAFIGSLIVQTHVAFLPAVMALAVLAWLFPRRFRVETGSITRHTAALTVFVLFIAWVLPLYEATTTQPGNLQLLIRFFVPKNWAQHSLATAVETVATQTSAMGRALLALLRLPIQELSPSLAVLLMAAQTVICTALFATRRQRPQTLSALPALVVMQSCVALFAVRAIRGDIEFYLVAWIAALGLLFFVALAAWIDELVKHHVGSSAATLSIVAASALMMVLTLTAPVARASITAPPDPALEDLAKRIEAHLRSVPGARPLIRIASQDTWPTAIAVVLHLTKQGLPVFIEERWTVVAGRTFLDDGTADTQITFGDAAFGERIAQRREFVLVARTPGVVAYVSPVGVTY